MSELREQAERAGQGLDVEALISARMEQVARAEAAEAVIERVRDVLDEWDDLVIDGEDPEEHIIRALDYNKGVNND